MKYDGRWIMVIFVHQFVDWECDGTWNCNWSVNNTMDKINDGIRIRISRSGYRKWDKNWAKKINKRIFLVLDHVPLKLLFHRSIYL